MNKLDEYNQQNLECALLYILFNSTIDQQEMLKGKLKHNTKYIFNKWYQRGRTTMLHMEKAISPEMIDLMDEYSERVHNTLEDIKNELKPKIILENEQA